MESNKITLVIADNPFLSDKKIIEIENSYTFRELFYKYSRGLYPIEQTIFIDKDCRVSDLDTIPTSDFVIIKVIPSGADSSAEDRSKAGEGLKTGGFFGFLVFGILTLILSPWLAIGAVIGLALIGIGAGIKTSADREISARRDRPSQQIGIRGSNNRINLNGRVPIIIGRHLTFPDIAGRPYLSCEDSGDGQFISMLFIFGYKEVFVDEDTLKIGDILFSNESVSGAITYDIDNGITSQHALYPNRVIPSFPGTAVFNYSAVPEESKCIVTTSGNTKIIDVGLNFPSGVVQYDDKGNKNNFNIDFYIRLAPVENPTNWFHPSLGITFKGSPIITANLDTSGTPFIRIGNSNPGATLSPKRKQITIDIEANTDLWNSSTSKTFVVEVYRASSTKDTTSIVDRSVVEFFNCRTFGPDDETWAIRPSVKEKLTTMALRVRASETINNELDSINAVVYLDTYVYDSGITGTTEEKWATTDQTSNPASAFLYVLTNPYINVNHVTNLSMIDWDNLTYFYNFCQDGGNALGIPMECNLVIPESIMLEDMLTNIVSMNRALWFVSDGKVRITIDTYKNFITQYFTPKNSFGFSGALQFNEDHDAIKMSFINETAWIDDEVIVYSNEEEPSQDNAMELNASGVTKYELVVNLGRYILATEKARPEVFTFSADVEYIVCSIGDRIQIAHDVPLIGSGMTCRVIGAIEDELDDTKYSHLYVDEEIFFDPEEDYGIILRPILITETSGTDENILKIDIANPASETNRIETEDGVFYVFELLTSIEKEKIADEMLCMPGIRGVETLDLIVESITPSDNFTAEIRAIPYSPLIFEAETGDIPDYNGNVTTPVDSPSSYNPSAVYQPAETIAQLQEQSRDALGRITYEEAYVGYDDPETGVTTVPATPVVTAEGTFRGIILRMGTQQFLGNAFAGYEIQVTDDEPLWYSLNFDETTWQGELGESTIWPVPLMVHLFPFDGTEEDPQPHTLTYRVRRLSKSTETPFSAWTTVTATQRLVDNGDVGLNTLGVNKLEVGFLQAAIAAITQEIVIGDDGIIGESEDGNWRIVVQGNEISFEQRDGETWVQRGRIGDTAGGLSSIYAYLKGLVSPGFDISTLDIGFRAPTGSRVFDLNNSYEDKAGNDPWTTKTNLEFTSSFKKFGTHALTFTAGDDGVFVWNGSVDTSSDFALNWWHRHGVMSAPDALVLAEHTIEDIPLSYDNSIHGLEFELSIQDSSVNLSGTPKSLVGQFWWTGYLEFVSPIGVGFGTDYIYSISSDINGNVYIGGDDGKFVISDDFGATFGSLVDVGFGTSAIRGVSSDINGMVYIGGASGKFAISDDFGATWSSLVDVGFGTSIINEISSDINGNIYVGGAGGKFTTSDDFGATWSSLVDVGFGTDYIYSISSDINGNVYIGGDDGKFVISDDFGATFGSLVDVGFGTSAIRGVSSDINGMVYIGGASGKFAISDDFGAIFGSLVDIGFETNSINIISCDINGNVYVGGGDGYFVLSTDFGSTWSIIVIEFLSNPVYSASSDVNGNVYIGGQAGYYTRSIANLTPPTADYPLQIKFQNDLTTAIKEALEDTSLFTVDSQLLLKTVDVGFGALTVFTVASCAGGKYIYIAGEDGSFAVSANYGITWSSLIDVGFGTSDIFAISCDNVGNVYIGGQAGKFAVSDDFGATWSSLIDIGFDSSDIVSISSDINGTVYIGGVLGKFVISTDFGSTFGSLVDVGFGTSIIRGVSSDINGIVYVGGAGGKFTTSDDFGATWSSLVDVGFGTSSINSVSSDINGMVYVAGESGKFVISDDFGATFGSLVDVGFGTSLILSVVSDIAGNVYVGGLSGKFAISDDFGATWSSLIDVGFGSSFIWGIALSSDYSTYYIVGDAGLFRGQFTDLFLTATFSGPVDVPDELDSTMTITRTVQGFSPNVDPLIYMTLGTPLSIAYLYDVEVDEDWSLGIFESGVFKGSIPVPQSAFSLFALERDGTDFRMRVGADSVLFTLAYTGGSSNLVINLYEDFSYVIDEILWYNDAIDSDLVNQYIGAEIPWSEGIDFEKDLIIAPAEDEGRIHLIGEVVSQSITEQIGEVISERSKITRLIAETSYVSNGIMYDSVDVITFGRRTNVYGGTLNGENGGDTYSSPYLLLKPIQETGTLIQVDMWAHGGCALYSTGNFYTCGYNNIGQLGFGDTTHRAILTLVTTDVTEYRRPACMSYDHNDWRLLVKKSDNYWYGVGYNANGALGLGDTTHRTTFTQLTALGTDVREVWNLGTTYGCVVVQQNDGTTLIAGFNGQGHFGIGSATAINHTWIDITSDWGITGSDQILDVLGVFGYFDSGVSSSSSMIMLISDNQVYGRVRTCGTNTWGSLGDTTTTTRTTPIAPTGVPDTIIKIQYAGGGPASAYALTNANVLWDWGHNGNGQLGIGSTSNQPTPQSRSNTKNIFARAYAHTYSYSNQAFIIDTNDELWAAGHNSNGQLGNGNQTLQTSWVRIPYDTRYGNIIDAKWNGYDSGGYYIMFLTDAGFVFGVGYNGRYGLSLTGEANSKLALTRLNFGII